MLEWERLVVGSTLTGAVLFAVGTAFHFLVPIVAPDVAMEYRKDALFRPWSGWTTKYMLLHPWLFGVLFSGVFLEFRSVVGTASLGGARDGLLYGLAVFVVGSLPVHTLNFASFKVSAGVIASWGLESLCQYAFAGLALGWCCTRTSPP